RSAATSESAAGRPSDCASFSSPSRPRAAATTCEPSSRNARTIAGPSPPLAPVTSVLDDKFACNRAGRCARPARREEGEYLAYLTDEQRSGPGCSGTRMLADLSSRTLGPSSVEVAAELGRDVFATRRAREQRREVDGAHRVPEEHRTMVEL